jgi:hypothetical protein
LEILIEHYRLGMKLSMPITAGDKTLLDVDASIDNERTLDVIKANGVKKVDVRKTYLKELSDAYPEFYKNKNDKISKAKEKGTESRSRAAESYVKARRLQPKPPVISILAKPIDLPDLQKVLMPYFQIEVATSKWHEINDKLNRSKVIVIWVDDFTEEEQRTIKIEAKKNHSGTKLLAVYRNYYQGTMDSVKWLDYGLQVFNASFLLACPDKASEFGVDSIKGVRLASLNRTYIQLISDGNHEQEIEDWMSKNHEIDVTCHNIESAKYNPASKFALVRIKNSGSQLPQIFNTLKSKGFNFMKMVVLPDNISKEEIEALKALGRVFVLIGGLSNEKLTSLVDKIKA